MQSILYPQLSKPPKRKPAKQLDFRKLLNRFRLGPQATKLAVIAFFTVCWLLVVIARASTRHDAASVEGSSLIALATSMQHGAISGRDFQSVYGPATQFLATVATSLPGTESPLDAYGMIVFLFCGVSAVLIALTLLICERVSWLDCVIVYAFCFFLNLFFDVLDLQTGLLLLSAAFAYRIIAAETLREQMIWATATGFLCFFAQLVTFELGLYVAVLVVGALIIGSILTRSAQVLLGIEFFIAALAVSNIELLAYFKLTSTNNGLVFDYPNYSFEILRGFHNSMGILWQLSTSQTLALLLAFCYVIGTCIFLAMKWDPLDASLFASMTFAAVIWVRTALVSSDIAHITLAFTPMVVVLALLATKVFESKYTGPVWALAVCAVLFVWPSFSLSAPKDLVRLVRGKVPVGAALFNLQASLRNPEAGIVKDRMASDSGDLRNVSAMTFPYGNHITARLQNPLSAPVLESYAASTDALERYYIQSLENRPQTSLDIVYGPDKGLASPLGDVQAITRTPAIFDYMYRHFDLASSEEHRDGYYELRGRSEPRDVMMGQIEFSSPHELADSGTLKLNAPSTCGLVRLQLQIDYTKSTSMYRPSPIQLSLANGDQMVWQGSIISPRPNHSFVTYVSPLPPATFHKVFGQGPIQSPKWDHVDYTSLPADMLGSKAGRIRVESISCFDPQKFLETVPVTQMATVQ
jgi:hypothetical protein